MLVQLIIGHYTQGFVVEVVIVFAVVFAVVLAVAAAVAAAVVVVVAAVVVDKLCGASSALRLLLRRLETRKAQIESITSWRKEPKAKRTGGKEDRGALGGCRGRAQRSQQLGVPK